MYTSFDNHCQKAYKIDYYTININMSKLLMIIFNIRNSVLRKMLVQYNILSNT